MASSQTPELVSGRRRRSWLALIAASALASAAAVGLVALRDKLVFLRTVSAVGSDGVAAIAQPVGLLTEKRTALKGVISDAKGAWDRASASAKARGVGRLQLKADKSGAFSGGWSIGKMLKNGLDWDGQEGVKSGSDVIMVPPPLVVPKPPMTITINGGKGGGDIEAGKKITSKVRCACLQLVARSVGAEKATQTGQACSALAIGAMFVILPVYVAPMLTKGRT